MVRKLIDILRLRYWQLGFTIFDEKIVTGEKHLNVKFVKGTPRKKWYADPFILQLTERTIEVLVEEFTYSIGRGRIARLSIDRKTLKLLSETLILDLPTHLSFPAIYRENNNIYIYPENSASGCNTMYEYDIIKNSLKKRLVTVTEPVTDAVIFNINADRYMLATAIPEDNSNHLLIFKDKGHFHFEKYQDYYFDRKVARNAGDVLSINGSNYKVSQDCNKNYGGGVIFHKIDFKENGFTFQEVSEIHHFPGTFALHTFNEYDGICVIDVLKPRHPFIDSIFSYISNNILRKRK